MSDVRVPSDAASHPALADAAMTRHPAKDRITVLYDAFGDRPQLESDWGIALLVEFSGMRILFDTGNNPQILARNVHSLDIDLADLDFVVISHRHGDHTSGLGYLLQVNPAIRIYVPAELFGVFGSTLPPDFYRSVDSLPPRMRYFGGAPRRPLPSGTAWPGGNFVPVDTRIEIERDVFLVPTVSERAGTREMPELSLALRTDHGIIVVVGCSHTGIEEILDACSPLDSHVHLVIGGLHLVKASDEELERVARALRHTCRPDRIAPGHCTGEPAFAKLQEVFADAYEYAGLGTVVEL